jgi:hypothetical protein
VLCHRVSFLVVGGNTVRLTSTGDLVSDQEFCLAPSETMVEQVNKIKSLTYGIV